MRETWVRREAELTLGAADAALLVRQAIPGARVTAVRMLPGGLINTNLDVTLRDPPGRVLLRLIQRSAEEAQREAAVNRLVSGHVPTARFLHFADSNPVTGHPFAVLEWIEGERLDMAADRLDDETLAILGHDIGGVLAAIHAFRFDTHGFFDARLHIPDPVDFGPRGLLDFLRSVLNGEGGARLGQALAAETLDFVERHAALLEIWQAPPCLVHADFNATNILVNRTRAGRWRVAAVLDWEFALSGLPAFDFGNLLRPPLGQRIGCAEAVGAGYVQAGGSLPARWQRIAAIIDLVAWVDMLSRRSDPGFLHDMRTVMQETIGTN